MGDGMARIDDNFAKRLKEISLERALKEIDKRPSVPKLTQDILGTPSWKKVEDELLEKKKDKSLPDLRLRRDNG